MTDLMDHFAVLTAMAVSYDELDRFLEDQFHPQCMAAEKVKHPRSGWDIDRGIELRLHHPERGEGPAHLERWDHGDPLAMKGLESLTYPRRAGTEPLRHVYRGMSTAEWEQAKQRGYIRSDQRGTIADWEGTNAGTHPGTAASYLPRGGSGVIAKIRVHPEDKWFTHSSDDYVRTREPIPLDRVEHVSPVITKDSQYGAITSLGAARLPRGQEACGCCEGTGRHGDLSCARCEGEGHVRTGSREPYCPQTDQDEPAVPRRRHWREASAPEDYGISHRPLSDGAPAHDLTEGYAEDIYTHPQYWASPWPDRASAEGLAQLRRARGKPEAMVDIYRASHHSAPHEINTGDWVTLSPSYAGQHAYAESGSDDPGAQYRVHHARVPAKHVRDAGTDQYREQGYWGPPVRCCGHESARHASSADYRQPHQGPDAEDGEALHELGTKGFFPPDVHERPEDYGADEQTARQIRRGKADPDARIVMYRAMPSPHHRINPGDWVTLSEEYARMHAGESDPAKTYAVLKKQVRAHQLRNDGNDLSEWTYHGPVQHFPGLASRGGKDGGWKNLRELQRAQEKSWNNEHPDNRIASRTASAGEPRVEHAETFSGGATYPRLHTFTATHPDGTQATLSYMLSKRGSKGVADRSFIPKGYAQSLGVPLIRAARAMHPGSFIKGLPGLDEDWDRHLPSVTSIHRNLTVKLSPEDREHIHDQSVPRAQRARFLMDVMARGAPSMHWASQRGRAAAEQSFGDHEFRSPEHTQISLSADPPAREHVETDPERISRHGGYAYQPPDWEVPVKEGVPVQVNSVRWRTGGSGWESHRFKGGHQFTAARQREGDERRYGDYTMRYHTEDMGERRPRHVIEAHDTDGAVVGRLNWYGTTGVIHRIEVADEAETGENGFGNGKNHMRKGIATAMWNWGQEMSPRPKHSGDRTEQGKEWAKSVGGPGLRKGSARYDPGYPNPHTGGDEWFHGTQADPESLHQYGFGEKGDQPYDRMSEDLAGHHAHWNTLIGPHFAASHTMAGHFATHGSSSRNDDEEWEGPDQSPFQESDPQDVYHARLHMRNPKVYESEHDMDHEAYEREHGQRKNYIDRYLSEADDNNWDDIGEGYSSETEKFRGDSHRTIGRDESYTDPQRKSHPERAAWLTVHPDKAGIARRFRENLEAQGHDGIIYRNKYEDPGEGGPHASVCAIPFRAHQVEITQHHPAGQPHLSPQEAEMQRRRMPQRGQDMLPGAEEHRERLPRLGRLDDDDFRRTLSTTPRSQLVRMTLKPGEEIGAETHRDGDQHFVVVRGRGRGEFEDGSYGLDEGDTLSVPAGTRHNVRNTGPDPLHLVTFYAPPQHEPGTVHHTKADAIRAEGAWYHGTNQEIGDDGLVTTGNPKNYGEGRSTHVYFTESPEAAHGYARWAAGRRGGEPHVYEVEPGSEFPWEEVGSPTRNAPKEYKTRSDVRVKREIRHTAAGAFDAVDWDEIHPQIGEIHRGIGLTLPDKLHHYVHDSSVPREDRARALLDHVSRQDEHGYRGSYGMGTHWTLHKDVAEDFAEKAAKHEAEHVNRETQHPQWGMIPGEKEHGVYTPPPHAATKPGTAVVFHAHPPEREDIDEHAGDDMGVYHPFGHGESEIPLRSGASVHLKGISWSPMHDWEDPRADDEPGYERHDFPGGEYREASLRRLASAPWLPSRRIFGPTYGLDHRLFDERERIRPEVREALLDRIQPIMNRVLGADWKDVSSISLAGSEASKWTSPQLEGNNDLDVLTGIAHSYARDRNPELAGLSDAGICEALNREFRDLFNDESWTGLPGGPWHLTAYCNDRALDIRRIRPYAAYDLLGDRWVVKPPDLPDWSAASFGQGPALFAEARAVAQQIRAVLKLPEPYRTEEAKALWDHLHERRSADFSEAGRGWQGTWNIIEKYLDQTRDKLIDKLRAAVFARTAAAEDYRYEHLQPASKRVHWVNAYHPDGHRVGDMTWHAHGDHHVTWIAVYDKEDRRKGIATGMWNKAREVDPQISHNNSEDGQTDAGRAWAATTSALMRRLSGAHGDLPGDIQFHHLPSGSFFEPHTILAQHPAAPDDLYPKQAGYIQWWGDHGNIANIRVHPDFRRRGLATEMFRRAQQITPHIRHSDALSQDAREWIPSLKRSAAVEPVTISYAHNRSRAPDLGEMYGQHIEPHGRYLVARGPKDRYPEPDWETGEITFRNPLHIPFGGSYSEPGNWKRRLSEMHGGKTGRALSRALTAAGHDAVITHDDDGRMSEIVDLTGLRREAARERYVTCDQGHEHWGAHGAAFLLLRHTDPQDGKIRYLFQHRADDGSVDHPGTWGLPGGALHEGEDSYAGARREAHEEMGGLPRMRRHHTVTADHGGWQADTHVADVHERFRPRGGDHESQGYRWVTKAEADQLDMHPGVAKTWETVRRSQVSKQAADSGPVKTKDQVNYREGTPDRHCGNCSMIRLLPPDFESAHCTLVKGLIDPDDVCDEWDPAGNGKEAAVRQVRSGDGPDGPSKSVMIAIVPPAEALDMLEEAMRPLTRHDPEPRSKMHITLLYLGKEDDHPREHLAKLPDLVRQWSKKAEPFHVKLQGAGTFVADGNHVLHALADIPGGPQLRASLEDFLAGHGIRFPREYGFIPHLTLAYSADHVRFLPKIAPVKFPVAEVWFCRGGTWESIPLGKKMAAVSS